MGCSFSREFSNPDACIQCDDASAVCKQWIDVQLGDFPDVHNELGDLHHRHCNGFEVCGRPVAVTSEQANDLRLSDGLMSEFHIQRWHGQCTVSNYLNSRPALSEHDHRTEEYVLIHADKEFMSPGFADHRLNGETVNLCAGIEFGNS